MALSAKANYVRGVVICHGKSELLLTRHITSNLHLNIQTFAKDKGEHSIQISGLLTILNTGVFKSQKRFLEKYLVETVGKGKNQKLTNFKLFIIMDTDDCNSQEEKEAFINGKMFSTHWLAEYIVPIYNIESFEDVMLETGIIEQRPHDNEKAKTYLKVFPINPKPLSDDTVCEVTTFRDKVGESKKTNLKEFINYCLFLLRN